MNTIELIDTHAHLYLDEFSADLDQVLERAAREGVSQVYLPGLDSSHTPAVIGLEEKYPGRCFAMAGLHPCYVKENYTRELEILRELLTKRKFAAIGEIGLDYYWDRSFDREQKTAFEQQLEMSFEYRLPVVIHSRSSMDDTTELLQLAKGTSLRGIFHCFSGNLQNARDIIGCGLLLGIGGVVTYKNAGLAEVLADVPLEHLVLETDAPYLSPVPFRGKRNESSYLRYILGKVAEVKGTSEAEVARITTENARRVFA